MKLYKFVRDGTDKGDYHYEEVDPAELELAALKVLGEFHDNLTGRREHWRRLKGVANEAKYIECCSLEEYLETLESSVDLGEIRKIQEKAKAWDLAITSGYTWFGPEEVRTLLARARTDLEKGEEKDE